MLSDDKDLQVQITYSFYAPKLLEALPIWKHGSDDIARCTWYYRCPCDLSLGFIHQSQIAMHLKANHALPKWKIKKILERSRNYFHANKYEPDYVEKINDRHKAC